MSFAGFLRQSTAVDVKIGPFVDATDGDAEETALTINAADVILSKNGQTGGGKNDNTAAAHAEDGMYNCEFDATDTNTVGQLTVGVHVSGALFVRHDFQVLEEAAYDFLYAAGATPIVNIWAKAGADPGGVPAVTASMAAKIDWLLALARNKMMQTSTTSTLRNDADGADVATSSVSDDGSTFTRGEWA